MDLTKLSDADLDALEKDNYEALSEEALNTLSVPEQPKQKPAQRDFVAEAVEKEPWYNKMGLAVMGGFASLGQGARQLAASAGVGEGPSEEELADLHVLQSNLRKTVPGFVGEILPSALAGGVATSATLGMKAVQTALSSANALKKLFITAGAVQPEAVMLGALNPVEKGGQSRGSNIVESMVLGAGLPFVATAGKHAVGGTINAAKSLFGGASGDVAQGRILKKLVGKEDIEPTLKMLEEGADSGLTTGQLAARQAIATGEGRTALPAAEEALTTAYAPDIALAKKTAQEAGRISAIAPADEAALRATRKEVTTPMREAALSQAESVTNLYNVMQSEIAAARSLFKYYSDQIPVYAKGLIELSSSGIVPINTKAASAAILREAHNPQIADESVRNVLTEFAKRVSDANGNPRTLYEIEKQMGSVLDTIVSKMNLKHGDAVKSIAVSKIKPLLTQQLDAASGNAFSAYKKTYANLSRTIDQARVMKILQQKLAAPLEGAAERATVLSAALENDDAVKAILKKGTGGNYYKSLQDLMAPEQMQAIQRVQESLNIASKAKQMAAAGKEPVAKKLAAIGAKSTYPSLDWKILMAQRAANALKSGAGEAALKKLAVNIQDPAEVARLIKVANAEDKKVLARHLVTLRASASAGAGIGARD